MTDPDHPSTDGAAADRAAPDHLDRDQPAPADERPEVDALVGAVLDGEATPDEEARVQADPALRARLTEMKTVRTALAASAAAPRLSEEARSRLLATALATAHDPDDRQPGNPSSDAVTVPIPLGRSRATHRSRWLVGAAAATIAVVVALAIVATGRNESSDAGRADSAASAGASDQPASATDSAGTANDEAAPPSTTTTPESGSAERSEAAGTTSLPNLGDFPDVAALATATRAAPSDSSPGLPLSAVVACPGELDLADLTGAMALGRALVAGQSVVVGRAATNDVAIVESTCAVLPLS